jgi:hypothetical protein
MYLQDGVPEAPGVADRALQAERGWSERMFERELERKYTFRGAYPVVFRNFSSYTHVTTIGIMPFIVESGPQQLSIVRPINESKGAVTLAPVLFGEALLVAAEALGWPRRDEVLAIFTDALEGP